MSISHTYDKRSQWAIYVCQGTLGVEDFIEAIQVVYGEQGQYPLYSLWDLREADLSDVGLEGVEKLGELTGRVWREDERGKTAIVANRKLVYGLSRMFQQTVDGQPRDIAIFEDIDSARNWLAEPAGGEARRS